MAAPIGEFSFVIAQLGVGAAVVPAALLPARGRRLAPDDARDALRGARVRAHGVGARVADAGVARRLAALLPGLARALHAPAQAQPGLAAQPQAPRPDRGRDALRERRPGLLARALHGRRGLARQGLDVPERGAVRLLDAPGDRGRGADGRDLAQLLGPGAPLRPGLDLAPPPRQAARPGDRGGAQGRVGGRPRRVADRRRAGRGHGALAAPRERPGGGRRGRSCCAAGSSTGTASSRWSSRT